ncbi:MAG TPA: NAD(P)H-dependent oxidoreductase [Verrucomicrobiae bacterium]|jgi:FMN-dependent NADH-azoreductase|nr:NAD(P)H-dependent oxidoreductase [Verrucomicrobiae bacterium]
MATLLKLDSSPMGERSISRKLTTKFAESWLKTHPGGKVVERDLTTMNLPVVDAFWAGAVHTPEASRTAAQVQALATSDSLINDLEQADEYVFGVPMHNFSIPSKLKLWIDQIVRAGKTFSYGATGPKGLLTGKKATLLLASGGEYGKGSAMASFDFVTPYLQTVLAFIGITDVTIIAAGGTAQLMSGKTDPQTFLAPSLEKVHAHASL